VAKQDRSRYSAKFGWRNAAVRQAHAAVGEIEHMPVSGLGDYDDANIFARILRGEVPCREVFRDRFALAFHDIQPRAPVHVLVIPTGRYVSMADFSARASQEEIAGFFKAVGSVAKALGLEEPGYRILANMGGHAHQEVPHFHVHIFGGRPLGAMLVE
jgi:diadenosine tetraphosphate (Ap4A) HIT family hydrolase